MKTSRKARQVRSGRDGRDVFAEVTCPKAPNTIDGGGEEGQPCGLKMQITAPAVLIGKDVLIAGWDGVSRRGNVDGEEGLHVDVAGFAPVEAGVGDQDFYTGEKQGKKSDDCEPVRDADDGGVAVSGRICGGSHKGTSSP